MKRFLVTLGVVSFTVAALSGVSSATPNHDKVWICHGLPFAASHPYNLIHVDEAAVDGGGKNDHTSHVNRADRWDDIIPAPNEGDLPYCPNNETPPTTTVPPSSTSTTVVPPTTVPPVTSVPTTQPPTGFGGEPPTTTSAPPVPPELAYTGFSWRLLAGGLFALGLGLVIVWMVSLSETGGRYKKGMTL